MKLTKRRLKCLSNSCAGVLNAERDDEFWYCETCKDPENESLPLVSSKFPELFESFRGVSAEKVAAPDVVLVASRHLFRMPYSLHEKTALASVVLTKEELERFSPRDADPLKVVVRDFMPHNTENEAQTLLARALDWARGREIAEEKREAKKYGGKTFEPVELSGVTDEMFPPAIIKLMKGLSEGRKRGLFVLITFLRGCGFSPEEIHTRVKEWNEKNDPPLKEGYVRSQLDWHFKQRKKILPPNYANEAFYRDIGIIDKKPETKNPLVDVMKKVGRRKGAGS